MFLIYKSNRFDILINRACNIIKKNPLSDPFQNEIFLVNNIETTQWIKLFIANKLKISANIGFFKISDFIWKLFKTINLNIENQNKNNISSMTWKIMQLIETKNINNLINKNDSQLKKIIFASHLSHLFKKYLIYRPEWINFYKKNHKCSNIDVEKKWQGKLWNDLINNCFKNQKCFDVFNLLSILLKKIKTSKSNISFLPFRFFICNISDIPIPYLYILYSLSKYYKIYLLMTTPYVSNKFISEKIKNTKISHLFMSSKQKYYNLHEQCYKLGITNQINPILLSCGQHGYEYLFFLLTMKNKYFHCYSTTYKHSLLNNVQKNILQPINKIKKNKIFFDKKIKKIILNPKDKSISIHICCNIQREVEILHDNLLNLLNKNPSISPKNIIVKTFKLHIYIPFINSVFNSPSDQHQIPFFIFNKLSDKDNEILLILNKLFNLDKKRLYNQEIFELLQSSALAKKFYIEQKEIPILFNLIYESGIRWGIDQEHIDNLLLPKNMKHTWEYGIKKIILGYSINEKHTCWNNTFPYTIKNKSNIKIICKIINLIKTLKRWQKKLSTLKSLKTWLPLCSQLIDDFFYKTDETKNILEIIEKKWIQIVVTGIKSNYKKKFLFQYYVKNCV